MEENSREKKSLEKRFVDFNLFRFIFHCCWEEEKKEEKGMSILK